MSKVFFTTIVLFALATHAQSQDLAKREKIKALFSLMHQDSLMIKTIDGMTASMVKNMATVLSNNNAGSDVDISKMSQKLMERSMQKSKENALKLINTDMVDIYDKYFTAAEIDDFSTFYKSKSGQKMLTQMPDITKDIMAIMTTKYQTDFQQSMLKDIQEITEQMKTQQQ